MNVHPIFVHFPIALLTLYALLEIIPNRRLRQNKSWQDVKAILVFFGVLGAFAALETGDMAKRIVGRSPLVLTHSFWAEITTIIFSFLAVVYMLVFVNRQFGERIPNYLRRYPKTKMILEKLTRGAMAIMRSPIPPIFALAGLAAITITGALGGAIVYGPDVDPVVKAVYSLFF